MNLSPWRIAKRKYVVIPIEYNYLVNPTHPDFAQFNLEPPQPFELDPRLWKNNL